MSLLPAQPLPRAHAANTQGIGQVLLRDANLGHPAQKPSRQRAIHLKWTHGKDENPPQVERQGKSLGILFFRMRGERLKKCRHRTGLTQTQLAVALGERYNGQMISMVEHNQRGLLLDGATKAARELNVSLDYLVGLTDDPTPAAARSAKVSELDDASAVTADDEEDGHSVDVMELHTAAGAGAVVDFERVKDRIRFRQSWLRKHGLVARQCKVIGVKGTSMEPTLTDGCSILIDLNRRRRTAGHLYVIRTDDGLIVKRAGKNRAGNWQLVSDNKDKKEWPTRPWPADAELIGEVKWAARTF